jgi:hypothetical protein
MLEKQFDEAARRSASARPALGSAFMMSAFWGPFSVVGEGAVR